MLLIVPDLVSEYPASALPLSVTPRHLIIEGCFLKSSAFYPSGHPSQSNPIEMAESPPRRPALASHSTRPRLEASMALWAASGKSVGLLFQNLRDKYPTKWRTLSENIAERIRTRGEAADPSSVVVPTMSRLACPLGRVRVAINVRAAIKSLHGRAGAPHSRRAPACAGSRVSTLRQWNSL
jgi:hypothetical protein